MCYTIYFEKDREIHESFVFFCFVLAFDDNCTSNVVDGLFAGGLFFDFCFNLMWDLFAQMGCLG